MSKEKPNFIERNQVRIGVAMIAVGLLGIATLFTHQEAFLRMLDKHTPAWLVEKGNDPTDIPLKNIGPVKLK